MFIVSSSHYVEMKKVLGESYAKELRNFSLADNFVGRRISDSSKDVRD
jgi:hypothetical protein